MNTFECRSCKRQFQNSAPSCPSNQSHAVVLVKIAPPQLSLAPNRPASNTLTLKTEGPFEHGGELPTSAPLSPGDWTKSDRENSTQRWIDMEYSDIAPIIRPFSQAEKNRLHTPEWQRIFTLVCDDNSILAATRDLGLPETLRTQWINREKRFLH